jgi:tetratricopeptide (TPR) repeat protein
MLAYVYTKQGDLPNAENEVQKALEISPESPELLSFGGGVLVARHKLDEGLEMLGKAKELNPGDWMAHYNLGSANLLQKKYRESASEYFLSFKIRKSFSTLQRLFVVNVYIYRLIVAAILTILSLFSFYMRSVALLSVITIPTVLVGLMAVLKKDKVGFLMILLGIIPLVLFSLTK